MPRFSVVVAGHFHVPEVQKVNLDRYAGATGDVTTVKAIDDDATSVEVAPSAASRPVRAMRRPGIVLDARGTVTA